MRRWLGNIKFWLLVFALSWLVMIVVQISRTPDLGAASPDELAFEVGVALRNHDARKLTPLVSVGGLEVAQTMTERFAGLQVEQTRFVEGAVVVEFVRTDLMPGSVRLPATEQGGRWQVSAVVAP